MTDTIKLIVDLSAIPTEHLKQIRTPAVFRSDMSRPSGHIPFEANQNWLSPFTGKGMKIKVIVDRATHDPKAVVLDINVPSATVGQNAEMGHSVFAASTVALEMVKLFLAQQQVPLVSLDQLSLDKVQLDTVVLTYLLPTPAGHTSQNLLELVRNRVECLHPQSHDGKRGGSGASSRGSTTAYFRKAVCGMRAYSTPANKISAMSEAMLDQRIALAGQLIRLEITLNSTTLKHARLNMPSDWENAHEGGVYQTLFNKYLRQETLRLDDRLRQDAPDAADLDKLSEANMHIVSGYLAGKPLKQCTLLMRDSEIARQKAYSKHRLQILEALRIDINIPWAEHRKLGSAVLGRVLVYPGDYSPPTERVADSFCKENFPSIRSLMRKKLLDLESARGDQKRLFETIDEDGVIHAH